MDWSIFVASQNISHVDNDSWLFITKEIMARSFTQNSWEVAPVQANTVDMCALHSNDLRFLKKINKLIPNDTNCSVKMYYCLVWLPANDMTQCT